MGFDAERLRNEFPILSTRPGGRELHYLDNAATAQLPLGVIDALFQHETTARANVARGVHALAERATQGYEEARAVMARYVNAASADEIVFTSGTTASINIVARAMGALMKPGDEVVVSELEHHSNLVPWQMLRDRVGVVLRVLPVSDEGRINLAAIGKALTRRCRLVALTHVSNVTGAVTDVAAVVDAARQLGGVRVLLDGAQAVPHGPVDVRALGVDFYAFSGHKMFAPNGIGVLWGRLDALEAMPPVFGGGGMIQHVTLERASYAEPPRRFEAGTPPIAQAVGLAAAARWVSALDREGMAAHEMRLTGRMLDGLAAVGARVLGPAGLQSRRGVVSFAVDGVHPHDLCQWLSDRFGVALRGGHHCAEPLMRRFGIPGCSRASVAPYNTEADIDALLRGVADAKRALA